MQALGASKSHLDDLNRIPWPWNSSDLEILLFSSCKKKNANNTLQPLVSLKTTETCQSEQLEIQLIKLVPWGWESAKTTKHAAPCMQSCVVKQACFSIARATFRVYSRNPTTIELQAKLRHALPIEVKASLGKGNCAIFVHLGIVLSATPKWSSAQLC